MDIFNLGNAGERDMGIDLCVLLKMGRNKNMGFYGIGKILWRPDMEIEPDIYEALRAIFLILQINLPIPRWWNIGYPDVNAGKEPNETKITRYRCFGELTGYKHSDNSKEYGYISYRLNSRR